MSAQRLGVRLVVVVVVVVVSMAHDVVALVCAPLLCNKESRLQQEDTRYNTRTYPWFLALSLILLRENNANSEDPRPSRAGRVKYGRSECGPEWRGATGVRVARRDDREGPAPAGRAAARAAPQPPPLCTQLTGVLGYTCSATPVSSAS